MKKFKVEKLVRDNILDSILKNKLNKVSYKVLNKKKFLEALKKKFFEELEELDFKDTDRSIKELADLQLIIDTCLKVLKVNKSYFR
jgi:predicted house-cleaning noncanonical NTP pyrophosphatase (MazG superfamily)